MFTQSNVLIHDETQYIIKSIKRKQLHSRLAIFILRLKSSVDSQQFHKDNNTFLGIKFELLLTTLWQQPSSF